MLDIFIIYIVDVILKGCFLELKALEKMKTVEEKIGFASVTVWGFMWVNNTVRRNYLACIFKLWVRFMLEG